MSVVHGKALGKALIKEGLCPPLARNVELHVGVSDAVFVRYEVLVDAAGLEKAKRAITTMLNEDEELKRVAADKARSDVS